MQHGVACQSHPFAQLGKSLPRKLVRDKLGAKRAFLGLAMAAAVEFSSLLPQLLRPLSTASITVDLDCDIDDGDTGVVSACAVGNPLAPQRLPRVSSSEIASAEAVSCRDAAQNASSSIEEKQSPMPALPTRKLTRAAVRVRRNSLTSTSADPSSWYKLHQVRIDTFFLCAYAILLSLNVVCSYSCLDKAPLARFGARSTEKRTNSSPLKFTSLIR